MKGKTGDWTALATLLVFTLFAICLLLVLLTGAGVYRRLADRGDEGHVSQTAAQYITTRVHQGREPRVEDFEGCEALTFSEEYGGTPYLTRIYCWDGWLRELFSAQETSLSPADGEKILKLDRVDFSLENGVLTVIIQEESLNLTLREGRQIHEE